MGKGRRAVLERPNLLICLLLVAPTIAVYAQILGHGFVSYDDTLYVTKNGRVLAGPTIEGIRWALTTLEASGCWHPLTWMSHMLDCRIFGLWAGGHHATSLMLHLANVLILFIVLSRMTDAPSRSAVVAALFALHPLHVESVAWVSERKDVLSTFFFLIALGAYASYARRPGPARYGLVAASFAASLMAKPMFVTFPFLLLLFDVWPLRRTAIGEPPRDSISSSLTIRTNRSPDGDVYAATWRRLLLEKAPLLVLSGIVSVVTLVRFEGAILPLDRLSLPARMVGAVMAYAGYIGMTLWPRGLAVLYPLAPAPAPWKILGSIGLLGAISFLVFRQRRLRPYLATGWLWYLGSLIPVIGLVQTGSQSMADRYTYVPLIGLFLMMSWGVHEFLAGKNSGRRLFVLAGGAAALACAYLSWRQAHYWRESLTLFDRAVTVTENNFVAHTGLGNSLHALGRTQEATQHYEKALRDNPEYYLAHYNLGMDLLRQGKLDAAIEHHEHALRVNPAYAEARLSLGFALYRRGRVDEAIGEYEVCLRLRPDWAQALNNLAWIRATNEDPHVRDGQQAVALAQRACALSGSPSARFLSTLGAALAEAGRFDEAVGAATRALEQARAEGHTQGVSECRRQIRLYESRQPLRIVPDGTP